MRSCSTSASPRATTPVMPSGCCGRGATAGSSPARSASRSTSTPRASSASSRRGTTRSPWPSSDAIPALLAGNAALDQAGRADEPVCAVGHRPAARGRRPRRRRPASSPARVRSSGPMVIDRVDYVMFTGSTRVGREVAARCGERLIGCSLELGGKNAMIIRADADIHRAAEIAVRACFSNSGPAVHLHGAHLRPRRRLRRVRGGVRRAGAVDVAGDRHRLAGRHGVAHLGTTARPRAAARRRRRRRAAPGCWPAARRGPTSVRSSSSPPCWRASRRT